jgi:hypothetical protein
VTRALASVAVLALISALAAGCSDDGGDSDDEAGDDGGTHVVAVQALTPDQIAQAMLQTDNLGDGWVGEPSTEDEGGGAPGCLADIESITEGLEEQDKGGTVFDYGDSALRVESTVSAYPDATTIGGTFDLVASTIATCTDVSGPDGDGNTWDLTLTSSDEVTYDDVDAQYAISGSGTITGTDGTSIDVYLEQTAVRVGPNVGSITTFDTQSRTTEHATWAEIAVERFVDVAQGEEPEATTAPAPA